MHPNTLNNKIVSYFYKDGELFSTNKIGTVRKVGYVRKSRTTSYKRFEVCTNGKKKRLYVHRKIWELHFGAIPTGKVIDHINHNSLDNRIENLRCVTQSENILNRKR